MKLPDIEDERTVKIWLSRRAKTKGPLSVLRQFIVFLREGKSEFKYYSPDELIKFQDEVENKYRFKILDQVQAFINDKNLRYISKKNYLSEIRSFFTHNRCSLPEDKGFRILNYELSDKSTLTIADVKHVILASNILYKAMYLCRFQSAMDFDGFKYWNNHGWTQIQKDLEGKPDIIRIEIAGRMKLGKPVPFHTYIGTDAIKALRQYISTRPKVILQEGQQEHIFYNVWRKPVTYTNTHLQWMRTLQRTGLIPKKPKRKEPKKQFFKYGARKVLTGKHPHGMRKIFKTIWRKSGVDIVIADFMMGHEIDKLDYDRAYDDTDWTAYHYRKVLPWLNIISEINPDAVMKIREEALSRHEIKMASVMEELAELRAIVESGRRE